MLEPPFGKVLQLSNFHVPSPTPEFGQLRNSETEYGWVFWVRDPALLLPEGVEPWLTAINNYAEANDCVLVEFDVDNDTCDLFEQFDW